MLNLSRHIESLLLHHNCVIIPELGGFITQYTSARYVEEDGIYLPPFRKIIFNRHLVINDGMLIQSYMSAYGICYTEAVERVRLAVTEIKATLLHEGKYELHNIGTLQLNVDGLYTFVANEAGTIAPNLYGLDSLIFKPQAVNQPENTATEQGEQVATNEIIDTRYYTIKLRRDVVNYFVAALVMLVCYFSWAIPVSNHADNHINYAAFFTSNFIATPSSSALTPKIVAEETPIETAVTSVADAEEASVVATNDSQVYNRPTKIKTYTIVVCSCIPQKNAERLIAELQGQGYSAYLYEKQDILRVVIGEYPNKDLAQQAIQELRKGNPCFKDAWVLKK